MQKQTIGIIIPVHNMEKYLHRCVDSVLAQTYTDLEIILVENGSTDRSAALCEQYALKDPRIRVIHLEKGDLSTARNVGIRAAKSAYLGFVDSDDYIAPTMYEELMGLLQGHDADVAMCAHEYVFEDGHTEPSPVCSHGEPRLYTGREAIHDILMGKLSNASWDKLFRREIFNTVLFPEGYFYEDHFMLIRWFEQARRIIYTPKVFYFYWQRCGSICHEFNPVRGYHLFLANFQRWEYERKNRVLSGAERNEFVDNVMYQCYYSYRRVVKEVDSLYGFRRELADMLCKLRRFRVEWKGLSTKNRLRLVKATRFTHAFQIVHRL